MSQFGIAVVWSTVQVTCVSVVAVLLYALVSGRGATARSFVAAASLVTIAVLTPLALCPLPWCWSWTRLATVNSRMSSTFAVKVPDVVSEPSTSLRHMTDVSLAAEKPHRTPGWWRGLFAGLSRIWLFDTGTATQAAQISWLRVVGVLFLAGANLSLLRFFLGLWGIRSLCRHGSRIVDAELASLVERLRTKMGCARPVDLRESSELTTGAAVGLWKSTILLPVEWRMWSESELRAVLAHELAHIHRADFLLRIIGQFSTAMNFYHPLTHWMASRLRLQQELAADLLAAQILGNRRSYLKILARMALRQEQGPSSWPARTLLPAGGTLMRRIQMLRTNDAVCDRPFCSGRVGLAILLMGVALCLSGLRNPAAGFRGDPTASERAPQLSLEDTSTGKVGSGHMVGVIALRPAALFKAQGMQQRSETLNGQLADALNANQTLGAIGLKIEDIELMSGTVFMGREETAGGKNILAMTLEMIQTSKDFDWKQRLQQILPDLSQVSYREHTYYKSTNGLKPYFPACPPGQHLFVPDSRTVVFLSSEQKLRELWDMGQEWRPQYASFAGWERTQSGFLALAINNRGNRCGRSFENYEELAPLCTLFENATKILFSIEANDKLVVRIITTSETEKAAKIVAKQAASLVPRAQAALRPQPGQPVEDKTFATYRRFALELLENVHIERTGTEVLLRAESAVELADLMDAFLALGI